MAKTLREIIIEYANTRGGGLPVTPEEMCNALVIWVQQQFSDEKIKELFPTIGETWTTNAVYDLSNNSYNINLKYRETPSIFLGASEGGIQAVVKEQWIKDNFFNAIDLSELFEGSDTVVVDINETNDKIEIHLDAEIVNKLQRAILLPVNPVSDVSIPLIDETNDYSYEQLKSLFRYTVKLLNCSLEYGAGQFPGDMHICFTMNQAFATFNDILNYFRNTPNAEELCYGYISKPDGEYTSALRLTGVTGEFAVQIDGEIISVLGDYPQAEFTREQIIAI